MTTKPDVRPGQVWADNDRRMEGRTLEVSRTKGDYAYCVVLTDAQGALTSAVGRVKKILIRRMVPNSTGYRLMHDVPKEEK